MDGGDAECEPMMLAAVILAASLDACGVLSKADVEAVQGEAFTATKLTTRKEMTTCFYQLPTFTKSVSVDVMRKGAREFFEEAEHDEQEEEAKPPKKIKGIGSEAMWVGGRVAGSLYVRKGDKLVRVSVGGPGNEEEKIAKSKKLAALALKKM
jgi:hypothetical protein